MDHGLLPSTDASLSRMKSNYTTTGSYCTTLSQITKYFEHEVVFATFLLTFSPVTVLGNITLIASFIATRQVTQNTSNILIFVLRFSDLAIGAICMPLKAGIFLNVAARDLCMKFKMLQLFNAVEHFSVLLTMLLAIDRYLHMDPDIQRHPSKLKMLFKKPNIYYIMILASLFCILVSSFTAFYDSNILINATRSLSLALLSFSIIFLTCLYTKGYLRIRHFADNNPVYHETGGPSGSTPDYVRRLYKTVLTLILLTFIQYVPYCLICITIGLFYAATEVNNHIISTYFFEVSVLIMYAGCFTNCFAVIYFNKQARHWITHKMGIK